MSDTTWQTAHWSAIAAAACTENNNPTRALPRACRRNCVPLREWFDYRGHVCMVFQRLGPSLFDFLRKNNYRAFPIDLVQQFSRQLLEAVAYMHDLQLVHTDLKPENILLVELESSSSRCAVRRDRATESLAEQQPCRCKLPSPRSCTQCLPVCLAPPRLLDWPPGAAQCRARARSR